MLMIRLPTLLRVMWLLKVLLNHLLFLNTTNAITFPIFHNFQACEAEGVTF